MESRLPTQSFNEQNTKRPVSRKSSSSSPSSSSGSSVSASSRAAKSGNGGGSKAASSHAHGTSSNQHHHKSNRASKRSGTAAPTSHTHSHHSTSATAHHTTAAAATHSHDSIHHDGDARHKRVWKACERCRMKKTKCDGEYPCKRCKDDGLVCTTGTRKKTEYKQLPKGYAEVLETTQFALVATVHKLYEMLRSGQAWELGEPEYNERGQPIIHSIASRLGYIRPNNDPDLPVGPSVFPENEQQLADLATQIECHQKKREAEEALAAAEAESKQAQTDDLAATIPVTAASSLPSNTMVSDNAGPVNFNLGGRNDRASSSEDYECLSDMDDYRRNVFGNSNCGNASSVNSASTTMSPQSLIFNEFEAPSPILPTTQFTTWMTQTAPVDTANTMLHHTQAQSQLLQIQLQEQQQQHQHHQHQHQPPQQRSPQQQHFLQQNSKQVPLSLSIPISMTAASMPMIGSDSMLYSADLLRQGLLESNFGAMEPHIMSSIMPDVMLGMGDPMIYGGDYDDNML
ncbi:Fluconazole resistance protein 1 [Sporothrix epigloea]|uniref:Fluconazole resistance protein 1 n=1 Tax=Sporothrix epigloea TaxID=1892477 RepID=A0ABP0DN03_9PEZI